MELHEMHTHMCAHKGEHVPMYAHAHIHYTHVHAHAHMQEIRVCTTASADSFMYPKRVGVCESLCAWGDIRLSSPIERMAARARTRTCGPLVPLAYPSSAPRVPYSPPESPASTPTSPSTPGALLRVPVEYPGRVPREYVFIINIQPSTPKVPPRVPQSTRSTSCSQLVPCPSEPLEYPSSTARVPYGSP